jgi:hypothetical protein
MVLTPLAHDLGFGRWVLSVGFGFVLIAAIKEEASTRRRLIAALLLGVPAVLGRFITAVWPDPPATVVTAIFAATDLFVVYIVYHILRDVMSAQRVTVETLKGAICIYLLMGAAWSIAYEFLEYAQPGSFSFPSTASVSAVEASESLYYFSFVTLTTLGYGDITPVSRYARHLAMLEAIVGQLFVAVMIARLVGLLAAGSNRRDDGPEIS